MTKDYTFKNGARLALAGVIIMVCCAAEKLLYTLETLVCTAWEMKKEIAMGAGVLALAACVPYFMVALAYLIV